MHPWSRGLPVVAVAVAQLVVAAPAAAQPAVEPLRHGEGLLWQVTPADGGRPSHIFGTMHVSDPRVIALADVVTPLVGAAETLALEVEMTPAVQAELASGMLNLDGPGVDELLSPEDFALLVEAAAEAGVPGFVVSTLRPWAVTVLVTLPREELARLHAGAETLDRLLQTHAASAGVEVVSLESPAEQLAVLNRMDLDLQLDQLILALEDRGRLDAMFETMTQLYLAEDLSGFMAWLEEQMAGEDPGLRQAFLDDLLYTRNRTMVERMEPLLEAGDAVIAVGAMHLPGEEGVLGHLERAGHQVVRVPLTAAGGP